MSASQHLPRSRTIANQPAGSTRSPTGPGISDGIPARSRSSTTTLACPVPTAHGRGGFARVTAEVALGEVGILLGLEASRLARNNTDWYKLLDLCSLTDTLIAMAMRLPSKPVQ